MKRYCKNIDITDIELIQRAFDKCFASAKKRRRHDTILLFQKALRCKFGEAAAVLRDQTKEFLVAKKIICENFRQMLISKKLNLSKPRFKYKTDGATKKIRKITVLNIHHLFLDHIAVEAIDDFAKTIGTFQVSSIKGKGPHYGKKHLSMWIDSSTKTWYAAKIDIRKFYESINREELFLFLEKHIKNNEVLWLIKSLVSVIDPGMSIGSFLSQTLANLFLSQIYHFVKESGKLNFLGSRGKNPIKHCIFYMDDMLFLSHDKNRLRKAVKIIIEKINSIKLQVKPNWNVFEVTKNNPIDMMGFRFSYNCITIRKRIFRNFRRSALRVYNSLKNGNYVAHSQFGRFSSLFGYAKHTNSSKVFKKYRLLEIFELYHKIYGDNSEINNINENCQVI